MKLLDFMIVGAQKCGTTALAEFLNQHSRIQMARDKEVHLFDSLEFSPDWTPHEISAHYQNYFHPPKKCQILGEATPIYLYLPEIASQLAKYNPMLKVIVLMRDPVERAYSQYRMERDRGNESIPFGLALLLEGFRLLRDSKSREEESSVRRHSYRSRGLYSRQLDNLWKHFPREQVLVVSNEALRNDHQITLDQVFDFLEIPAENISPRTIFSQDLDLGEVPVSAYLLRKSYIQEFNRLDDRVGFSIDRWR